MMTRLMRRRIALAVSAVLFICGVGAVSASAGVDSLLGKWQAVAQAPDRTMDLEFVFRQEGSQIVGLATNFEGGAPLTAIRFEEPNLTMDLVVGGNTYRLKGVLKESNLDGTWERVGSELKGTWSAKRSQAAATAPAPPPAGGVLGAWNSIASTPNGDMASTLEIKQEGENLIGMIRSEMGSLPIQSVSFKENKLQFDLELGDARYRIQAVLEGDKLTGGWAPAAGGDGGPWNATRKAGAATAEAALKAIPGIIGPWTVVAAGPEGNMRFVAEFKQNGDVLSGVLVAPDGSIPMQKAAFANNKLTFEVNYMGGTFRIDAVLENDKLTGKWAAIGGSENGTLTGERKKP